MKFLDDHTLELNKILNELDLFVLKFIQILEKHTTYVIISGYVSILLGRARSTEDIDLFIEELTQEAFTKLYKELNKDYWCLNAEQPKEIYRYLCEGLAVRFARQQETIPNFEIKFAKRKLDKEALQQPLIVRTPQGNLNISSLERQIAFKRYYLKSEKDLEDAQHIEEIFKEHINETKIAYYKKLLEQ